MTVFSAANSAAIRVTGVELSALFGSDEHISLVFRDLIQEVADDIVSSHDWRDLTVIGEFEGDGEVESFPRPSDFGRMSQGSYVDDPSSYLWGYINTPTINEWLRRKREAWIAPGGWIYMQRRFHFYPAPTGSASFVYISNEIGESADGAAITSFASDDDKFFLGDRILTLGLIWRYKAQAGLEYSEDLTTYENHLSQLQTRDKGARLVLARGNGAWGRNVAYPWPLGGK